MTDTELLDAITNFTGSVRLSNKAAQGYWWCYLDRDLENMSCSEIVVQGTSPREVFEKALREFEKKNRSTEVE